MSTVASIPSGKMYLFELRAPFERLEFQFVPEGLYWERSGNWVNIPIVGRNNSKKHLTGGEDKLNFQLDFNALYEKDRELCIRNFAFLQSLTASDGFAGPSRNVKIAWGGSSLFRHKVWIVRRVIGNMSLFHSDFNMNPQQIYVDVEMELDPAENLRLDDIRITAYDPVIENVKQLQRRPI